MRGARARSRRTHVAAPADRGARRGARSRSAPTRARSTWRRRSACRSCRCGARPARAARRRSARSGWPSQGARPCSAVLPARVSDRPRVHADDRRARRRARAGAAAGAGSVSVRALGARRMAGLVRRRRGARRRARVSPPTRRGGGRRSRHARSQRSTTAHGVVFVKSYPRARTRARARRAFAMGSALERRRLRGARGPCWSGARAGAGLLVTRDAGGEDLLALVARLAASASGAGRKRRAAARGSAPRWRASTRAGFVHGDLVPPNLRWRDGAFVFLDHDRTRRGRLPSGGARGATSSSSAASSCPGVSASDRRACCCAYATARGLDRRRRHRLGALGRCARSRRGGAPSTTFRPRSAARAGFRTLMRSGGPFDPARRAAGERRAMRRALVTLAHPQHAGMLRALRVLDDAAPAHGWELRYAFPACARPARRRSAFRASARDDRAGARRAGGGWPGALVLPDVLRARRGSRAAPTSSTRPRCPPSRICYSRAGSRASRRWCTCTRATARRGRIASIWLGRARHVIAPSADSLRLARRGGRRLRAPGRPRARRLQRHGRRAHRRARPSRAAARRARRTGRAGRHGRQPRLAEEPALLVEAAPAIRAAVPDVRVAAHRRVSRTPTSEARARERIAALGLARRRAPSRASSPNPVPASCGRSTCSSIRRCAIPFPLALLEGMALARPIVASAVGGIPEMLVDGESGLLVPPDDPAALAAGGRRPAARRRAPARALGGGRLRPAAHALHARRLRARHVRRLRRRRSATGRRDGAASRVVVPTYERAHTLRAERREPARAGGRRLRGDRRRRRLDRRHAGRCWRRSATRGCACSRIPHGGVAAARNAGHRGRATRPTSPSTTPTTWRLPGRLARPGRVPRVASRHRPGDPERPHAAAGGRPRGRRGAVDPPGGRRHAGGAPDRRRGGVPLEPGPAPGHVLPRAARSTPSARSTAPSASSTISISCCA